jgi:hypothetical protein
MAQKCVSQFGCGLVLKEPKSMKLNFVPDIFAVKKEGVTFQFEIKVSVDDWRKDRTKHHRINHHEDVGRFRYYVVPYGMFGRNRFFPAQEINGVNWGLIQIDKGGQMHVEMGPSPYKALRKFSNGEFSEFECTANTSAEMELVYSYYRKLVMNTTDDNISSISNVQYNREDVQEFCRRVR